MEDEEHRRREYERERREKWAKFIAENPDVFFAALKGISQAEHIRQMEQIEEDLGRLDEAEKHALILTPEEEARLTEIENAFIADKEKAALEPEADINPDPISKEEQFESLGFSEEDTPLHYKHGDSFETKGAPFEATNDEPVINYDSDKKIDSAELDAKIKEWDRKYQEQERIEDALLEKEHQEEMRQQAEKEAAEEKRKKENWFHPYDGVVEDKVADKADDKEKSPEKQSDAERIKELEAELKKLKSRDYER